MNETYPAITRQATTTIAELGGTVGRNSSGYDVTIPDDQIADHSYTQSTVQDADTYNVEIINLANGQTLICTDEEDDNTLRMSNNWK